MRPCHVFVVVVAAVCGSSGCATVRHETFTPVSCPCGQAIVFVADGAGGFESTSSALRKAIAAEGAPLGVDALDWSHGPGRFIADQTDFDHARVEGQRLAAMVLARRQACPSSPIYLMGHSAGSAVVLTAADYLPPGCVDEIVLLSSSISADYDLRPALRCSRRGIDAFYSQRDLAYLGLGVALVGTADRQWNAPAGRVGFQPLGSSPEDVALYKKLRQHCWDPAVSWTGNEGGHRGSYQPRFLQAYVLPLLVPAQPAAP
jgi:pimeloyl-ACP methyl ester carboxylesterase